MLEKVARQKRNRGILYSTLIALGAGGLLFLIIFAAQDNVPMEQRFRVYVPSITVLLLFVFGSLVYLLWWSGLRDNTDAVMRTLTTEERTSLERQIYPQLRGETPLSRKALLSDTYLVLRYPLYQRMIPLYFIEEISVIAKRRIPMGRRRWSLRLEIYTQDGELYTLRTPWAQNIAQYVASVHPSVQIHRLQEGGL